jgi:RecQ family ATP-dependent DNA helicase
MKFINYYGDLISNLIQKNKARKLNPIFVIQGQADLLDYNLFENNIADVENFVVHGDAETFDRIWFSKIFSELNNSKEFHLLSYPQFMYIINYIDASFFQDRIFILKDNLRQLYPIQESEFIEKEESDNIELRPSNMPLYQAEQIAVQGNYYYIINTPIQSFDTIEIFPDLKDLYHSDDQSLECIDVSTDLYSIDVFINECIRSDQFNKKVVVKIHEKQLLNKSTLNLIKGVNHVLGEFGGVLHILEEQSIKQDYKVDPKTQDLLVKYWGAEAAFRNISVYKRPDLNNEIIDISQAFIVETIIKEYENAKSGGIYRDLFLTAPTGAGKSLLFQLPSFYVSAIGDITIVVSPLIALMKDQVSAIINERHYEKVAFINSELTLIDRDRIIESSKAGDIDILYMSPELLLSYDITYFIGSRRLGLLVIDEAHLITTWGRDFRVDYWFLGNHIRKMRKFHNLKFPMVAVTATAIYGGANDMVFDSIDSLVMKNPHIFIGQVKRNDIEFIVNNHERFTRNYDANKIQQTVEFIQKIHELGIKTLVYTPFSKHIKQILSKLSEHNSEIATGYYGSMDATNREFAYRQFKSNQRKVMVSTKAFGMGVDIPDIQVVYHHAPSGLLPDYVQEIGRVARKPDLKGFATLNYSSQDQRYSKVLHGMSAIRQYQIREVLKKIHSTYLKNNKERNLLLSVDDFGHIFPNALDLDQKVLTALMMIEKDYLAKHRFNVLIARPKKLFVKVYARISSQDLIRLSVNYSGQFTTIKNMGNGNSIIEIDLDKLWSKHYVNKSFPLLKNEFYSGKLFRQDNIEVIPQLKMSFAIVNDLNKTASKFEEFMNSLNSILANINGYFTQDVLKEKINEYLKDEQKSEKIAKFILSSYSGRLIQPGQIEHNAFLQERKVNNGYQYRVFNTNYHPSFNALLTRLNNLFEGVASRSVEAYITNKDINTINYVRLGYLLDILELGTFEIKGGENPMVFIRINDPLRIERDSKSPSYRNSLLSKTLERYSLSNQIFDHFFLRSFSNSDRWNFIEDFFLGMDVDALINKYPGGDSNNVDVIEELKKKEFEIQDFVETDETDAYLHIFQPMAGRYYKLSDRLTLSENDKSTTLTISKWLSEDPVSLDEAIGEYNIKIESEAYKILQTKLTEAYPEYTKKKLGLKIKIPFKGFKQEVQASVIYSTKPVEFYMWWCKNEDKVYMSKKEKITLFDKVNNIDPGKLLKRHRDQM